MEVVPGTPGPRGGDNAEGMGFPRHGPPLSGEEERRLVHRMRAGEEAAFELFAAAYVPALLRFAGRRLARDPELAKEIVQTTLCRVVEKLDGYRGEAPLFTWLCACCVNEIAGHFRRLGRHPTTAVPPGTGGPESRTLDFPDNDSASPEETLLRMETSERVHLALDRLPAAYARCLEWRYLEDLDVGEIARRLRSSYKAAESLLSRARRAFQAAFEQLPGGVVPGERARGARGTCP